LVHCNNYNFLLNIEVKIKLQLILRKSVSYLVKYFFDFIITSQRPKKHRKEDVPNELDVFAVGRIRAHWCPSSTYEKLDEVLTEKLKLGETIFFCCENMSNNRRRRN
jgi:hypothetical protein